MAYLIEYTPEAEKHLRAIRRYDAQLIQDEVDRQLSQKPTQETRRRKLMRPNPLATWELRIGGWRVYYDVVIEPPAIVTVRAIGLKKREQVLIGGQPFQL